MHERGHSFIVGAPDDINIKIVVLKSIQEDKKPLYYSLCKETEARTGGGCRSWDF